MGRSSTRENKTRYQLAREELGLSREKASELLETIAPERIEKIESERSLPRPDEVLTMAPSASPSQSPTVRGARPSQCLIVYSPSCVFLLSYPARHAGKRELRPTSIETPPLLCYDTGMTQQEERAMHHETVTAAEMKALEHAANENGLLYIQMMENAGRAAFAQLRRLPGPVRLLVVAGKGNNGGDGFVMARVAAKLGWPVQLLLAEGEPKTPDAITNFALLHDLPVEILPDAAAAAQADAVVDALYGTGFRGALRPAGRAACELMNQQRANGAFVLAVDLPSGINADTGAVAEGAVQADLTVTFHRAKPLHFVPESAGRCGEVVVADIGIDAYVASREEE